MRIAVFASGSGSNFQSIVDATLDGRLDARVELCVSSRPDAGVVDRARIAGIPVFVLNGSIDIQFAELKEALDAQKIDIIALAGFLKRIPAQLIQLYPLRILNIHPALLPRFGGPGMYGQYVHEAVLAAGETISGATVHIVDEEYDSGPIVTQRTVPVLPTDSASDLAARVLQIEHELYPDALQLFAKNQFTTNGRTVVY